MGKKCVCTDHKYSISIASSSVTVTPRTCEWKEREDAGGMWVGSMSSSMMMGSSAMSRPNESMGPDVLCMGPACRRGGEEGGDEGSVRSWYSLSGRRGCMGSGDAQGGDKGRKRTSAILLLVSGGIGGGTRIEGAESDRVAWSVRIRLSSAELTLTTGLSSASFSESDASRSVMIIPGVPLSKRRETGEEGSRREGTYDLSRARTTTAGRAS